MPLVVDVPAAARPKAAVPARRSIRVVAIANRNYVGRDHPVADRL